MDNKIIVAILIIGIVFAGGYILYNAGPVVSAQGTSVLKVVPDEVSVYLNIETRNKTAEDAKNANSEISDKVLTELLKLGLDKKEIQFGQYSLNPEYDWVDNRQVFRDYAAVQQVIVKVNDFDKVAGIVDKSVEAGALINYINFDLSNAKQNEYKTQALTAAGQDAQIKAKATAAGLGKNVGRLVSVQSQNFNYPGPMPYFAYGGGVAMDSNAAAVKAAGSIASLTPQDIEVSATIEVQYKLSVF